jgi:hypothetical protein
MVLIGLDSGISTPKISGRNLQPSQPVPLPRNPLRALVREAIPDGLVWLDSVGLAHPEAARTTTELPFVFEIGRVADANGKHTVREAELVVAALPENQRDSASVTAALEAYARFVVATNPTRHARLSGRALEVQALSRNRSERSQQ